MSVYRPVINPYVIYSHYLNETNHTWPAGIKYTNRIVRFYELELIIGGSGQTITQGQAIDASKGDMFFRKPGMRVQGISGYYCYTIVFDPAYSDMKNIIYESKTPFWMSSENEMLNEDSYFENFPYKYNTKNFEEYKQLFDNINYEFSNGRNNQLAMKASLLQVILMLYNEFEKNQMITGRRALKNNYDRVIACKDHIEKNLAMKFSLDYLADMCGLSRNFFCKIFREIVGKTPFEFIMDSRMKLAEQLLMTTDMEIEQICNKCGVEDITYFYRLFKRYMNCTPASFRKNSRVLLLK